MAVLSAAATMAVTGCGVNPGAAAVVGPETITHDEVDDIALAVCSANLATARVSNQPLPTLASRGAREVALQILVETELSHQFGEERGVEATGQQVSQAVAQNESGLALLPPEQREDFRTVLREYASGQLVLAEIGRRSLGGNVSEDQAIAEGQRLRSEFVEDVEVEIDPRYGSFEDGRFTRGGSSLSVPVSDAARAGSQAQPGDAFVAALPASQQCS
jgi:hypothetical protein